jgi:hypothetical protein
VRFANEASQVFAAPSTANAQVDLQALSTVTGDLGTIYRLAYVNVGARDVMCTVTAAVVKTADADIAMTRDDYYLARSSKPLVLPAGGQPNVVELTLRMPSNPSSVRVIYPYADEHEELLTCAYAS